MSRLAAATQQALSAEGALASQLDNFVPREAQQRLSAAIAEAFEGREVLLAEAGTGTGKTFAYLVPALLKGRANYLCKYRLEQAKGEPRFTTREQISQFQRIVSWGGRTQFGDIAELEALPDDSPLLPMVTSTNDNCLGTDCPFWSDCFVVQARQRAQSADIVVVNHHLLLADLALKQEGFGEILPGAQAFVIDEAHQLPELAANFFGESFGMRPIQELARDCLAECKDVPGALAALQVPVRALEQSLRELRAGMEGLPTRGTRFRALAKPEVRAGFDALTESLAQLIEAVVAMADASLGLDGCASRAKDAATRLERWLEDGIAPGESHVVDFESDAPLPTSDVLWYELTQRGFRCQRTPLDVSGPLREHREKSHAAWVFTSATLAVGGDFEHIATRLGLEDPQTLLQPSPFDWPRQALCYLPQNLPEPNTRGFGTALIAALYPVLQASGGRAFLLFASHRALREAAETLRDAPWPLFVQGEAPRATLLERFRASGNGVLLGAASFREGVDVVGDALSVVVIDKLPFAAPDDPVFEARLEAIRRDGGNPFRDEQLPQAVIALKQGVGRLIRSETDRGVLVLCDPRLTGKPYGRLFLDSLPPFARTREVADVERFFGAEPSARPQAMQDSEQDWYEAARF